MKTKKRLMTPLLSLSMLIALFVPALVVAQTDEGGAPDVITEQQTVQEPNEPPGETVEESETPSEAEMTTLDATGLTITVGPGGDYVSISAALTALSGMSAPLDDVLLSVIGNTTTEGNFKPHTGAGTVCTIPNDKGITSLTIQSDSTTKRTIGTSANTIGLFANGVPLIIGNNIIWNGAIYGGSFKVTLDVSANSYTDTFSNTYSGTYLYFDGTLTSTSSFDIFGGSYAQGVNSQANLTGDTNVIVGSNSSIGSNSYIAGGSFACPATNTTGTVTTSITGNTQVIANGAVVNLVGGSIVYSATAGSTSNPLISANITGNTAITINSGGGNSGAVVYGGSRSGGDWGVARNRSLTISGTSTVTLNAGGNAGTVYGGNEGTGTGAVGGGQSEARVVLNGRSTSTSQTIFGGGNGAAAGCANSGVELNGSIITTNLNVYGGGATANITSSQVLINGAINVTGTHNIWAAGNGGTVGSSSIVLSATSTVQVSTMPLTLTGIVSGTTTASFIGSPEELRLIAATTATSSLTVNISVPNYLSDTRGDGYYAKKDYSNTVTVTVIQTNGGTISPSTTAYTKGDNPAFNISTNVGFSIKDVLADGVSVGTVSTYIFSNIQANHTITATFFGPNWLDNNYNENWLGITDYLNNTGFTVNTPEDFAGFFYAMSTGKNFSGKTVTLTSDIDLSAYGWRNDTTTPFSGIFDGDDYTVSGMSLVSTFVSGDGLFYKTDNAIVKNLTVSDSSIVLTPTNNSYAAHLGIIARQASNTDFLNVHVKDSSIVYNYKYAGTATYIGGIVGSIGFGINAAQTYAPITMKNCSVDGLDIKLNVNVDTHTGYGTGVGGLLGATAAFPWLPTYGAATATVISNCTVKNTTFNRAHSGKGAAMIEGWGGVVGLVLEPAEIDGCAVDVILNLPAPTGSTTVDDPDGTIYGTYPAYYGAGGIIGYIDEDFVESGHSTTPSIIKNNSAKGKVIVSNGIVNWMFVGGVVGMNGYEGTDVDENTVYGSGASIVNCYTKMDFSSIRNTNNNWVVLGNIIGYLATTTSRDPTITGNLFNNWNYIADESERNIFPSVGYIGQKMSTYALTGYVASNAANTDLSANWGISKNILVVGRKAAPLDYIQCTEKTSTEDFYDYYNVNSYTHTYLTQDSDKTQVTFSQDSGNSTFPMSASVSINPTWNYIKEIIVLPIFTVTYLPGTQGTFAEQVYPDLLAGDTTPTFVGTPIGNAGWTFNGWLPVVAATVTQDAVYVAQWIPIPTYSVFYNANGGTGTMIDPDSPYAAGVAVTVLANSFTRVGYTFNGWNTAANGAGTPYSANDTFVMPANDVTLYAQWTVVPPVLKYSVFYHANGGTGTMTDTNSPYALGATVIVLANGFTRTGYTFTGWNTAANGSGTAYSANATFVMPAHNVILYAQWRYTPVPPTGDDSNFGLWIAMMMLSLGVCTTLLIKRRKGSRVR